MTPSLLKYCSSVALACCLSACSMFGLTDEERERLAFLKESSALYYDTERYSDALGLIVRGLELAPDDYKLRSMEAWCYLQQVEDRPHYIRICEQLFDKLWEMREASDHGEPVLLGMGNTQTRLAHRHLESARALEREVETTSLPEHDVAIREARALEHKERARHHLDRATKAFSAMLDNELNLREAHRNLMEIAWARDEYELAVEHGLASLEHNLRAQREWANRIDQTMEVAEEHEARLRHQRLVDVEVATRSLLTKMHYTHKDFAAALEHLDALLRIDPTRSADYYNRARVHEELGHVAEARKDYNKFLMFPNRDLSDAKVKRAFEFTKIEPLEASHGR